MSWVMEGILPGEGSRLWAGNGWTRHLAEAKMFDDATDAQSFADVFHLVDCSHSHHKARETVNESRFTVRNAQTGGKYTPKPLVKNQHIFTREK